MSGNNRTYSHTELEEFGKKIATTTAELTRKSIMEELEESNLLKKEEEPGTLKTCIVGGAHKVTKHFTAFKKSLFDEGREVLIKEAILSLDEKKEKKEREAFELQMKEKYSK